MQRALGCGWLLLALACAGGPDAPPVEAPPTAPSVPPPVEPPVAGDSPPALAWPLFEMAQIPPGRSVALPSGKALLDLDVAANGRFAVLVTSDELATQVWTWDFSGPLVPVVATGVREVALSAFDDTAYALVQELPSWRIERGRLDAGGRWSGEGAIYRSDTHLASLVTSLTTYNQEERLFFARDHTAGRSQILSVRRSGAVPYEVTSPDGTLGPLTPEDVRSPPDGYTQPPLPLKAEDATPLSVNAVTGALTWYDDRGLVHTRAWDDGTLNWGPDATSTQMPARWTWSPNGYYLVVWEAQKPGVRLRNPEGTEITIDGPTFRSAPIMADNGRTLLGWTEAGVVTVAVNDPLAAVRYLHTAAIPESLRPHGMVVGTSDKAEQLYELYDEILYADEGAPTFASLDGMLEVLHAGFQAVFVRVERDLSIPRLGAFLDALEASANRAGERRVKEIAGSARRMLGGDYAFPEGERVKAEATAESELHRISVDFGDFHPRGPYATSNDLSDYFRAFKYIDLLQLTDEEQRAVGDDPVVRAAWTAWLNAQAGYLSGTRYQGAFGSFPVASPNVEPGCLPTRIKEHPRRVFPLSWGRDSEILERVTAHDDLPVGCTVPERVVPSGLDLLTALGSPATLALQQAEYTRWPELAGAHTALRNRFAADISSTQLPDAWLRLVQILGNDQAVPEGVSPDMWRRRLWETALASWTSFRHTTVLVNEASAAQMGAGGPEGFEWREAEPVRHVVDPVPAAWAQLATLLDQLAAAAVNSSTTDRLGEVLAETAADARRLGKLAEAQMANRPLTEEDYLFIYGFAGTVEHPYLMLSAAASGKPDQISKPDPMMRIVDIHVWNDPRGPTQFWHAAVGRPRPITVLIGDRGILIPGQGAVYGYYEVLDTARIDDGAWRKRVDAAGRPAWANP